MLDTDPYCTDTVSSKKELLDKDPKFIEKTANLSLEERNELKRKEAEENVGRGTIFQQFINEIRPSKALIPLKIFTFLSFGGERFSLENEFKKK